MNSSINKYIDPTTEEDVILSEDREEESGWTTYLQDYSLANNYHKDENLMYSNNSSSCSSLISDAAWNGTFNANTNPVLKRLNFKKPSKNNSTYTRCQDDLEDTASSPVNSPKIGINRRKDDVAFAGFDMGNEEKGSPEKYSYLRRNDKKNGENVIDIKDEELKKRGMCVMPMSALINYIK